MQLISVYLFIVILSFSTIFGEYLFWKAFVFVENTTLSKTDLSKLKLWLEKVDVFSDVEFVLPAISHQVYIHQLVGLDKQLTQVTVQRKVYVIAKIIFTNMYCFILNCDLYYVKVVRSKGFKEAGLLWWF